MARTEHNHWPIALAYTQGLCRSSSVSARARCLRIRVSTLRYSDSENYTKHNGQKIGDSLCCMGAARLGRHDRICNIGSARTISLYTNQGNVPFKKLTITSAG